MNSSSAIGGKDLGTKFVLQFPDEPQNFRGVHLVQNKTVTIFFYKRAAYRSRLYTLELLNISRRAVFVRSSSWTEVTTSMIFKPKDWIFLISNLKR